MRRTLLLTFLAGLVGFVGFSQNIFSGTVVDENNVPLAGASIVIKGSATGVATDFDGNFEIELSSGTETLVVSYIGYLSKEINAAVQSSATIQLLPDAQNLDEVVVTALGIEREKKRLGYSVQEVNNENLVTARETNVTNSLAGRAAGVQVTGGGSGVGSTSRIVIRGEGSLIPGNNSPLFVVDGVPISNRTVSTRAEGNLETDFGNGAADINPDDVESISILKRTQCNCTLRFSWS